MKKTILISLILIIIGFTSKAQWTGTNLDDNIYRNGNVGIGTTTPLHKLQVEESDIYIHGNTHYNPDFATFNNGIALAQGITVGNPGALITGIKSGNWGGNIQFVTRPDAGGVGLERMRITSDGYIGIGTSSPASILHIHNENTGLGRITLSTGAADAETYSIGQGIIGTSNGGFSIFDAKNNSTRLAIQYSTGYVGIGTNTPEAHLELNRQYSKFRITDNTNTIQIGQWDAITNRIESSGRKLFFTSYDNGIAWGNDGIEQMTMDINGYVGIGTSSPASILHVHNQNFGLGRITLSTGATDAETYSIGQGVVGTSNGGFSIFDATNNTTRLAIQYSTGYVGIGTNTPAYKLDVLGTIRAQEIKVDLNGADFVFEDSYTLKSLEEVEKFVLENKHLPEIEPAKEMEENGTNLGELNSKLLQKIEELTLYMIEQNNTSKKLIEDVQALKSENEILKAEIKSIKGQ